MASRISLPHIHLPRPSISVDWHKVRTIPQRTADWRPPRGRALKLLLFQFATSPLWLSTGIPAPTLPPRDTPLPSGGLAGDHVGRALHQLARRIWVQRMFSILLRVAWLPLLVGCGWLAVELRDGPDFSAIALLWIEGILIVPAITFAALVKPTRREVARMLDRSFDLQDRMTTAVENIGMSVPSAGQKAPVTYLQMADAANVITGLRGNAVFRVRPPVRELVLAVACALILAALFFMRGVGGGIPALAENAVPLYTPAAERLATAQQPDPRPDQAAADAPTRAEVQAQAARSAQAQQDLKHLANALADQAVTRSAAEAIQQGDYETAANLIREAAENADLMSEAARAGLADDLDKAANDMSPGSASLASAARDAAAGLREGGQAAKDGMNELGEAVDQTASDIVSQQELADSMRQAAAAESQGSASSESAGGDTRPGSSDSASTPRDEDSGVSESQSSSGQGGSASESGAALPQDDDSGGTEGGDQSAGTGDTSAEDTGGTGQNGASQPGGANADQPFGDSRPGDGSQPSDTASGQSLGQSNEEGAEGAAGNPGSGAGNTNDNQESGSMSTSDATSGDTGSGEEASDPNLTDAQPGDGKGEGAETDPRSAITLSRSPDASGVQTSSNGGAATSGSGGGVAVSGGVAVQGAIGVAGPDSNRVPAEYREIVEDYFSDLDDS